VYLFKHMEVVLMLAFGLLCATFALQPAGTGQRTGVADGAYATDATNAAVVAGVVAEPVAPERIERDRGHGTMPVVNVVGRRLTLEEKRASANAG
jgi:hypothetical protein